LISSSLISAPSFWRSHVLHDMRLIALPPFPARPPPERDWAYSAILFCTPAGPSSLAEARCRLVLLTSDQPATKSSTTYVQIVPSLHYPTAPYSPSTVDVGPYPPLTCSLAASFATKLLSFFTFHSSTLLTSSPFPSMSFATFVALRSRNIASAAKGPKVYDLTRPPAGGLAFRPRSPLGELTFALPNSPQTIVCSNFLPSLHAYTSVPRECVVYWYFFSNHSIVGLVCPTTGLALNTNGLYFTVL